MSAGKSDCLQVPPRPTQREKAVFVLPKTGTGQARTTLTHPGPSPAMSKVLESIAESDPSYRNSDNWLMGGWGSVTETAQDLYPGLTRIGGRPPCSQSGWSELHQGKVSHLGGKHYLGSTSSPFTKPLNSNCLSLSLSLSLSPLCLDVFPQRLSGPGSGLCLSVCPCASLGRQPISLSLSPSLSLSLSLTSSRLPTWTLLSFGINLIIFCYSWQMSEPRKRAHIFERTQMDAISCPCSCWLGKVREEGG